MDTNYAQMLPTAPPDGTLETAFRKGAFKMQRLVYRVEYYREPLTDEKVKGVRVTCTGCGETWIADYVPGGACRHGGATFGFYLDKDGPVASGSSVLCPCCGAQARCTHIGDFRNVIRDEYWGMTVGRLEDKLVLYGWLFQRITDKDGQTQFTIWPYEAYVVEKRKIVRLMGYERCMSSVSLFGHWEQRKKYIDYWKNANLLGFDQRLLEGSTAENSALGKYLSAAGEDAMPVTYLRLWQKHPAIENLIVQGAGRLIADAIRHECNSYYYNAAAAPKLDWVNWKEKRPAAMLGLSKPEFKLAIREELTAKEIKTFGALRSAEKVSVDEALRLIRYHGANAVNEVMSATTGLRRGQSALRCLRYTEKQKENTWMLRDYWRTAEMAGENIERNLFPKNLKREHDRVTELYRIQMDAKRQEEQKKKMEERAEAFAKSVANFAPLAFEKDGIFIRPVMDEAELILEGKQQEHCCGTYAAKLARGESMIFLMRHSKEPEKSWYTLELSKTGEVLQNRGYKNRDKTKDAQKFEDEWIQIVRERMKQPKKKKKESAA